MGRLFRVGLLALSLAGCSGLSGRWSDLSADDFLPGTASPQRFKADAGVCAKDAEDKRSYSVEGIRADNVGRHRLYNQAFGACMTAKGYSEREGWFD